jgi:hypothetical protein
MSKELQRWDLRSSGMLRSVDWQLVTDISGQLTGLIRKDQAELLDPWRVCYTETSVTNYQSTVRNTPEQRRSPRRQLQQYYESSIELAERRST